MASQCASIAVGILVSLILAVVAYFVRSRVPPRVLMILIHARKKTATPSTSRGYDDLPNEAKDLVVFHYLRDTVYSLLVHPYKRRGGILVEGKAHFRAIMASRIADLAAEDVTMPLYRLVLDLHAEHSKCEEEVAEVRPKCAIPVGRERGKPMPADKAAALARRDDLSWRQSQAYRAAEWTLDLLRAHVGMLCGNPGYLHLKDRYDGLILKLEQLSWETSGETPDLTKLGEEPSTDSSAVGAEEEMFDMDL